MPEIVFDEQTHIYRVNGNIVPSVTQVMDQEGLVKFWNKDPWYMERGRYVHEKTQMIDNGTIDWTVVDDRVLGYLQAYLKFKDDSGITWEHSEEQLYHPQYHYCGTPDRFLPLHDIKLGQGDTLQLEGYAELLRANGFNPGREAFMLNLKEDGTYKRTTYKFSRTELSVFLSAVTINNYKRRKGLI